MYSAFCENRGKTGNLGFFLCDVGVLRQYAFCELLYTPMDMYFCCYHLGGDGVGGV